MSRMLPLLLSLTLCALVGCGNGNAGGQAVPVAPPLPTAPLPNVPASGASDPQPTFSADPIAGWQRYSDPEAGFTIKVPPDTEVHHPDLPAKTYITYGPPISCTVVIETLTPDKQEEKMKQVVRSLTNATKGPPQREVTLSGRPAIELERERLPNATYKREPPVLMTRVLRTDSAMYILTIEGRRSEMPKALETAYFDSFQLTK